MKSRVIALSFTCAALACAEEVTDKSTTLDDALTTIGRLEAAGKWEEALPIYKRWHEKLSLAMDGLSVGFVLRMGICQLQCDELDDAEKSFSWIVDCSSAPHENVDKLRAMFYLSEAMARNEKQELSRSKLDNAIRFFDTVEGVRNDATWIEWRERTTAKISKLNYKPQPEAEGRSR